MCLCKQGSTGYLVTMELRAQQKVIAVYARDDEQREGHASPKWAHIVLGSIYR